MGDDRVRRQAVQNLCRVDAGALLGARAVPRLAIMLASSYQRVRLWSGISAIVLNLVLAWGLFALAPAVQRLFPRWPFPALVALCLLAGVLLLLPFEVLTGHAVERLVERSEQSLGGWLGDWLRGVARYFFASWCAGLAFGYGAGLWWPWRVGITAAVLAICFLAAEYHFRFSSRTWRPTDPAFAKYESAVQAALAELKLPSPPLRWMAESDSYAVNGMAIGPALLGSAENFALPAVAVTTSVIKYLKARQTALMVAREVFQHRAGFRRMSLMVCLGWLLAGLGMVWSAPAFLGAMPALNSALLGMAIMTTWCLVALFIWPMWNRYWVRRADGFLLTLAPLAEVQELLVLVQQLNATDIELPGLKTTIFHPIPPLSERLHYLSPNEPNPTTPVLP
jgi:hypothetical protein